MEGQNYQALSLEQCLLKLEPHDLCPVGFAVLGIIALNCAIVHALSNLLLLMILIVMASLARLTIADSCFYKELALLGHNLIFFHTVLLLAYSLIKLFVGTLYKTLDKYHRVCYNQRQLRNGCDIP